VVENRSHRLKLHRARQHIQTLNAQVASFGEREPFSFSEESDPEHGLHSLRIRVELEPPLMWSILVGDALQDMRASLDHLAYSLAIAHSGEPPKPQEIEFPIFATREGFRGGRKRRIGRLAPRAQATIQRFQPYRRRAGHEGHTLWVLHDLARIDRHRAIHILPAVLQETEITVESIRDMQITETEFRLGSVQDGKELAAFRTRVTGPRPQMHVEVSPFFGISFEQDGPGRGSHVVDALGVMRRCIGELVFPALEFFL